MKLLVLIVSNQVRGIDGTGGLGDVATALAKALAVKEDIDVRILMPGYKTVSGIPVYLNTLYRSDPYLGRIATLYTTHNAGYFYQGAFPDDNFAEPTDTLLFQAGFDKSLFQPLQTRSLEHQNQLNFTKGVLGFADLINTVSITYSHEIQTPSFGGGFDHLLQERSRDLCGSVQHLPIICAQDISCQLA
jgi:glycogen synthase